MTKCRRVFDASLHTKGKASLNDLMLKGRATFRLRYTFTLLKMCHIYPSSNRYQFFSIEALLIVLNGWQY